MKKILLGATSILAIGLSACNSQKTTNSETKKEEKWKFQTKKK